MSRNPKSKVSKKRGGWHNIAAISVEFWRAHPFATIALILATVLPGISYGVYIFVIRELVNVLVYPEAFSTLGILQWLLIYVIASLFEIALNNIRPIIKVYLENHAVYYIQQRINEHTAKASLIMFEDGNFYDYLQRASNNLGERLSKMLDLIVLPLWQVAIVASITVVMLTIHPWIIPIMVCGIIPSLIIRTSGSFGMPVAIGRVQI